MVQCVSSLFFFSSRRRHTRLVSDWSSDVCSSDLGQLDVGSAKQAISADKQARIIFTSDRAITSNAQWDPKQLTNGLISHGVVNIYGADKADQLTLVDDAQKGASILRFNDPLSTNQIEALANGAIL